MCHSQCDCKIIHLHHLLVAIVNDVELSVLRLLDDEEFDFDLPLSPVHSEQ